MDVAPGSVVRKGSDRGKVYVDIFPPGTNLDAPDASTIERENGKNDGNVDAKAAKNDIPDAMDHGENASIEKKLPLNDAADKNGATEFTQAEEYKPPEYHDPAPSGVVKVINRQIGSDYVLDFGFDDNAPAAIFRRGANIFILFGTNAKFNIDAVKKSNLYNAITPVSGDGVAAGSSSPPAYTTHGTSALTAITRASSWSSLNSSLKSTWPSVPRARVSASQSPSSSVAA